jgi:hypothetical protein
VAGDATREQLDAIAERSHEIREARYPQITWEHSHVFQTPDGLKAFCLYDSPDPDSVKQHAAELGLPLDPLLRDRNRPRSVRRGAAPSGRSRTRTWDLFLIREAL